MTSTEYLDTCVYEKKKKSVSSVDLQDLSGTTPNLNCLDDDCREILWTGMKIEPRLASRLPNCM